MGKITYVISVSFFQLCPPLFESNHMLHYK